MTFDSTSNAFIAHDANDDAVACPENVAVFRLGGSLLYPAMHSTKDAVLRLQDRTACHAIIIDFTCCTRMDYTGCQVCAHAHVH